MHLNPRIVGCGERSVVLCHGYGGSQAIWDKLLPRLAKTNKVLLFDWDFSGGAAADEEEEERYTFSRYADDLVTLMDEVKLSGAVYVGHSMAGMVGCIASLRRPDLFTHLVLVGASPRYMNSEDYDGGFDRSDIDVMLRSISSDFHSWAKGFVSLAVGGAAADPSAMECVARSFFAMEPHVAYALARMIFVGDQREVLDRVAVPCTMVHVSEDFAAPPRIGLYMQGRMKRCRRAAVEIIDSVGHFPQLVAPDDLQGILDRVLAANDGGHGVEELASAQPPATTAFEAETSADEGSLAEAEVMKVDINVVAST